MSVFKRGIKNQKFIAELNINPHFQKMIADEDLFIAIRNEYLNVYYYGQSICKIEFVNNKIKWSTHKKYLGINESGYDSTGSHLGDIEKLKKKAREYGGKEKEQVKEQILEDKSMCILDVEVTFGREENFGKRSIDYLAVEKNNNRISLVFYEAKHFDNSEIRAREIPKVFEQIKKYERALTDPLHQIEILSSFNTIYNNVLELNLNNKSKLTELIGANNENIEIDNEPRLIIFEIDPCKMNDQHIQKLEQEFGQRRLILKERMKRLINEKKNSI